MSDSDVTTAGYPYDVLPKVGCVVRITTSDTDLTGVKTRVTWARDNRFDLLDPSVYRGELLVCALLKWGTLAFTLAWSFSLIRVSL